VSTSTIPQAPIGMTGPLTRGDFVMQLYWFADASAVPETIGIAGLARLTRLALILGVGTGATREIQPFFSFHRTPQGGLVSADLWSELLALRSYQVLHTVDADEPMPAEELEERKFMLEKLIPVAERKAYPLPKFLERDLLTNKGTFFAAKREDQTVQKRVEILKALPALNRLSLAELSSRALPLLAEAGPR
jgi:hypothetical protein